MSKFVKDLELTELRRKFANVSDLLVVNVIGMDAIESNQLRLQLRKKGIELAVVKNKLVQRILTEKGLSAVNPILKGTSAVAWGGPGIVELAKEITEWAKKLKKFEIKGACVSGQKLDAEGVSQLSKFPSREELIGQVIGRALGQASRVVMLAKSPGATIAGQLKTIYEKEADSEAKPEAAPA